MSRRRSFEAPGLKHRNPIPSGCIIGNLMMSGGIFGQEPDTGETPADAAEQCRLMFENIRRVMAAAGGSPADIIKVTMWLKDDALKAFINPEWLALFPDEHSRPARHTLLYSGFSGHAVMQCEVVAVLGG